MDSDRELVKRCITGQDAAWEALLQIHTHRIYNFCYRFTGRYEDAEDLTQEIFIKVFQTLKTYDETQAAFSTWLNRVARNHLIDHYRRRQKDRKTASLDEQLLWLEETPDRDENSLARIERQERRERVQAALDRIAPDLREAVILRDFQDMDYAEIAQVLEIPEGTVKSRIYRGRLELGRVLKRMER